MVAMTNIGAAKIPELLKSAYCMEEFRIEAVCPAGRI
jgi:hypothetical protein